MKLKVKYLRYLQLLKITHNKLYSFFVVARGGAMERHFDTELQDLKKNIMSMGVLVEQAIVLSVEALKGHE